MTFLIGGQMNQQVTLTSPSVDSDTAVKGFYAKMSQMNQQMPPREIFPLMQFVVQLLRGLPQREIQDNRAITLLLLGYTAIPLRGFNPGYPGSPTYNADWVKQTDEYGIWKALSSMYPDFVYNQAEADAAANGIRFMDMSQQQNQQMVYVQTQQGMMMVPMSSIQNQMGVQQQPASNVPRLDHVLPNGGMTPGWNV